MQWLAALSVKRPVFASVLILALTVIGAFSFSRLGLDRFPKVDFPTVLVTTRLPGARGLHHRAAAPSVVSRMVDSRCHPRGTTARRNTV